MKCRLGRRERPRTRPRKGARAAAILTGVGICLLLAGAGKSLDSSEGIYYFPNTPGGPQARTRPELDAFGIVMEAESPAGIIAAAEDFAHRHPDSQLLPLVMLKEMDAEMNLNSYEGTIALGHEILRRYPDNLKALALMAEALPNFPPSYSGRKQQILAEAGECRRRAANLLEKLRLPEGVSPRDFAEGKSRMIVSLHASAGFAALVGGQYQEAIREYLWVLAHGGENVPAHHLCLGLAYQHAGEPTKARLELHKAMDAGSGVIRERAAAALRQVSTESQ